MINMLSDVVQHTGVSIHPEAIFRKHSIFTINLFGVNQYWLFTDVKNGFRYRGNELLDCKTITNLGQIDTWLVIRNLNDKNITMMRNTLQCRNQTRLVLTF
ncbi:MAG: hypothetical protein CMJ90_18480 [Planctomycetes bacterium]|nr:hypothetical protein [Planctomycetota bacterium]